MKNKNKKFAILTLALLGFFILPKICRAAEKDILISEIAAYEISNYEWLEIYNKGTEPVDLTGWKFYEDGTNHSLNEFQGDLLIEPNEYAIIADVAENFKQAYPEFIGTIIDSSWTTLREDGEEIGLKNSSGDLIELFTYLSCPDTSLQKINLSLADYRAENWQVHATANSAGRINEFDQSADDQDNDADNQDPDLTDDATTVQPRPLVSKTILINEFVADPVSGGDEWVELYNKNAMPVDLTGWKLLDGSDTVTALAGTIGAKTDNPFLVITNPKGKLNNSGDAIILKDQNGNIMDLVYYGDWQNIFTANNAPAATDPYSVARLTDGGNTDNNATDFAVSQTLTKGQSNIITPLPPVENTTDKSSDTENNTTEQTKTSAKIDYKNSIRINEIYPNPEDSYLSEFIELKNITNQEIDLQGWQIQDDSKKNHQITAKKYKQTIILPDQYFIIERTSSGLALNNDKDTLKLISPDNKTVQTVKYQEDNKLNKGASFALSENDDWAWTTTVTKNQPNSINLLNHPPQISLYCPKTAEINESVYCDASDSTDSESDPLSFNWQIQDQTFQDMDLELSLAQTGTYIISLIVSDGKLETKIQHSLKITAPKTTKLTTTQTSKTSVPNNTTSYITTDLVSLRQLPLDSLVKTTGVVSVLPNMFGKTIMYLAGSGVQLYMYKANWPDLQIGDQIEVIGTITESKSERRIKLTAPEAIKLLGHDDPPVPEIITMAEIGEDLEGYLVQVTGQLIEISGSKLFIQDETGEAEIYLKTNTGIKKSNYHEGDNLTVTGVISQNNTVYQLLPRFADDIQHNQTITQTDEAQIIAKNYKNNTVIKYLITGAIFLIFGLAIVFYKNKKTPAHVGTEV